MQNRIERHAVHEPTNTDTIYVFLAKQPRGAVREVRDLHGDLVLADGGTGHALVLRGQRLHLRLVRLLRLYQQRHGTRSHREYHMDNSSGIIMQ